MRGPISVALVAGVLAALGPLSAATAADNEYLDSDPRPGSTVELEPSRVTIAFTEDVPVDSTTIVVRDSAGKIVTNRDHYVEANNIYANLPYPLPSGVYRVDYRALDDGVPFGGSFEFAWDTEREALGLSQWRTASKIPPILALPGDDELLAAEKTPQETASTPTTTAPSDTPTAPTADDTDADGLSWWWLAIPFAVLLAATLWWFVARRRRTAS